MFQKPRYTAFLALLAFFPDFSTATIHCDSVVADHNRWNILPLAGEHTVFHIVDDVDPAQNESFRFNLCATLELDRDKKSEKGCTQGSWACGFSSAEDSDESATVAWSIAGTYPHHNGKTVDPLPKRIAASGSNQDADREGLRIEYGGGEAHNLKQKMIATLECDQEARERKKANGGSKEEDKEKVEFKFVSYKAEKIKGDDFEVLRVETTALCACEDQGSSDDGSSWGFFTWLVIIVFLVVSAYLIFGSWLNYNRHGARGWDLLPHGDTIRDVPYLLKDWGRRLVDTVQGSSNRGGYNQI